MNSSLIDYILHLADNSLILAQRNSEWCGHGPVLEQDIAITNISLDLIGQSRNVYQYAAKLIGGDTDEDKLAYLRTEREFKNCLLVEQPNGDWGQTILRQFLFSQYQYLLYEKLSSGADEQLSAIAAKALKEVAYHLRWSSEWVIRLGDGTEESHDRMIKAVNELWPYTGELFMPAEFELKAGPDVSAFASAWLEKIKGVFGDAGLAVPEKVFMQSGGKTGTHTEHMGYILAEMQTLQRTYPGASW
ncbi:MAG: phenylacetate-CoA oxygenase subunit PaaC [Chitinophagaceae bacterium]|nr:phenylacetate-CoA oxygenase subunit PaaC [Chitinophagaceae bacterium]MBL0055483.1 phenylacetate-CoA oxygenase subunit PaaC [Chitinophagaceae bacterium]